MINDFKLSLRDNNLSKLGKEISILKKLKHLDITNNNFESLDDAIEGLISIPLLKELSFDLRSAVKFEIFKIISKGRRSFIVTSIAEITKIERDENLQR